MSRQEILQKLEEILSFAGNDTVKRLGALREDMHLLTDMGLSSVGMLYMVIAIEESFGIRFENVGMNDFTLLGDVVQYIEKHLP